MSFAMTLLAVVVSAGITAGIEILVDKRVAIVGIFIAIFIPAILSPIFTYISLNLVSYMDQTEERLSLLSHTDELTGTFNRRYFFERAVQEFKRSKRSEHSFTLALMDFDRFKDINDSYGHLAGDAALKYTASMCLESIREVDIFARYGGDEFIFLFPETSMDQAKECLERILDLICDRGFEFEEHSISIKVSMGVAEFQETMETLDDVLREADFALYAAKRQGGMRVILHPT